MNNLTEYYESLLETFSTPGWKVFEKDLQEALEGLNNLQNISDSETFWQRKGQVEVLQRMLAYRDGLTAAYEEMQDAEGI